MSNFVEQIRDGLNTVITTAVPSYVELNYIYDIAKNDFESNDERYGVAVRGLVNAAGIIRHSTVDQTFEVILTNSYANDPDDDTDLRDTINLLHDKMDDILALAYQRKVNLPGLVLLVDLEGMDEPEIIEEHKVVALRMNLLIKYRRGIVS